MKNFVLGLILIFSFAQSNNLGAVAAADQNGDLVLSRNDLSKSTFFAGEISYELRAQWNVNVIDLMNDINTTNGETAESIHDKINEKRQRLYPDQEIILIITIPKPADETSAPTVSLVKAIYWWNHKNAANYYWYAQYSSTVATMFIDDVKYGKYNLYIREGNGDWIFKYLVLAGGSATRYIFGSLGIKGFKGSALIASQADIVMYFFK